MPYYIRSAYMSHSNMKYVNVTSPIRLPLLLPPLLLLLLFLQLYIHRSGRTARANATGTTVSLVAPEDAHHHNLICSSLSSAGVKEVVSTYVCMYVCTCVYVTDIILRTNLSYILEQLLFRVILPYSFGAYSFTILVLISCFNVSYSFCCSLSSFLIDHSRCHSPS